MRLVVLALVALSACVPNGARYPEVPDAGRERGDNVSLDPPDSGYEVVCPTHAPFDLDAPGVEARCTRTVYLAGSNFSRIFISDDAEHWSLASTLAGTDGVYQKVQQFTSGLGFLVNVNDASVSVSSDGMHWTDAGLGWPFGNGLAFASDTFVQYGGGESYSNDGVEWFRTPSNNNFTNGVKVNYTPYDMAFFAGSFYAVGAHDPGSSMPKQPAFRSSSDLGKTWTDDTVVAEVADTLCGAAASPRAIVVVGTGGFAASSTDGTHWTTLPALHADNGLYDVIWDGSQFIALGPNHLFLSSDGATWVTQDNPQHLRKILHVEPGYLAYRDRVLLLSTDLANWNAVYTNDAGFSALGSGRVLK